MYRLPNELETLAAYELMEQALEERRLVSVAYFRQLKDAQRRPRVFADELPQVARAFGARPMLSGQPFRRMGEPVHIAFSREGNPYATLIMYGRGQNLVGRTVRIDRICVLSGQGIQLRLTRLPFKVAGTGLDPTIDRRPPR